MDAAFGGIDASWMSRAWMGAAMGHFHLFTLVFIRLSGLVLAGPLLGSMSVPMNIRALFVLVLALIVTPTIHGQLERGFHRLDADGNGYLSPEERPPLWTPADEEAPADVSRLEYLAAVPLPRSLLEYAWLIVAELTAGLLMGLGIQIVIAGLQLAGQIIDQQSGFGLGEIFNPDLQTTGSQSGQLMFLLGTTLFLVMDGLGGHAALVRTVVESFQTLPPGRAGLPESTLDLANALVTQSLSLALRFTAPLVIVMSMVDLTMGFLGHTVPQINLQSAGFAIRALVSFAILGVLLHTGSDLFSSMLPPVFEAIRGQYGLT